LDAHAVALVLKAAESSRYHAALALIAATGLRKGEALALRWDRVDLAAGTLKVAATLGRIGDRLVINEPKTDRARRTVPLSPAIVALLRKHKVAQAAEQLRAGDLIGADSGLVITTELGGPVDPRSFLRVSPPLDWVCVGATNVYGKWSKDLFADAAIVDSPGRLIFVAGMAAEDPADGHIHHRGDCAAQTRMAYDKIKAILAAQGADLSHVVRIVAYLTDMRDKNAYEGEQRQALGGIKPPPHSLIGVSSLAWPGMVVEVEATAFVPA
jgi:enamine deaminase RidA (YjgF/YER057c/UK114 family)